jgi:CHAD domain-containing protein
MRHRLRKHANVAAELVRLTRDDLAAAIAELGTDGPLDQRVHSVRQHLKWVRSTLRVLEEAVGEEAAVARREAGAAARLLSTARDADVAAASARVLSVATAPGDDAGFERLADALDVEAAAAHRQRAPLGDVEARIESIGRIASTFETDFDGKALLNDAIARAYRRGRKIMRRARAGRATADLHGWRKHAKHLWHLARMARPLLPRKTTKWAEALYDLTELLGLDHDHAMLAERLALAPDDGALARQLTLIVERRQGMESEAFRLGDQLYGEKPKDFARRNRLKTR